MYLRPNVMAFAKESQKLDAIGHKYKTLSGFTPARKCTAVVPGKVKSTDAANIIIANTDTARSKPGFLFISYIIS